MSAPVEEQAKPVRRLRFSLRSLLILVLLLSVVFAWLGVRYQEQQRENQIAEAINEIGGQTQSQLELLGLFQQIVEIDLTQVTVSGFNGEHHVEHESHPPSEGLLRELPRLKALRSVSLSKQQSLDYSLVMTILADCPHLETLDLSFTKIDDDDLLPLARIRTLRELDLTQTQTTEQGIARLQEALPDLLIYDD